jgi:tetratricopeptide (TPR) repeat protein
MLTALEKYDEALEYFDKISNLNPKDVYALYGKATVFYEQGKSGEALEYYNNILNGDPKVFMHFMEKQLFFQIRKNMIKLCVILIEL